MDRRSLLRSAHFRLFIVVQLVQYLQPRISGISVNIHNLVHVGFNDSLYQDGRFLRLFARQADPHDLGIPKKIDANILRQPAHRIILLLDHSQPLCVFPAQGRNQNCIAGKQLLLCRLENIKRTDRILLQLEDDWFLAGGDLQQGDDRIAIGGQLPGGECGGGAASQP